MSLILTNRSRVVLDNVEPQIERAAKSVIDGLRDRRGPREADKPHNGDDAMFIADLPSGWRLLYHITGGDVVIDDIVNARRYSG